MKDFLLNELAVITIVKLGFVVNMFALFLKLLILNKGFSCSSQISIKHSDIQNMRNV